MDIELSAPGPPEGDSYGCGPPDAGAHFRNSAAPQIGGLLPTEAVPIIAGQ
jgi:hypothetical protein